VLREGDWSETAGSALVQLGCWLLDDSVIDFVCPALDLCLHPPTAPGVLAALAVAAQREPAAFARAAAALQPAQRRHLRSYMLQTKWFAGGCGGRAGGQRLPPARWMRAAAPAAAAVPPWA
jgi:hypothetical protein